MEPKPFDILTVVIASIAVFLIFLGLSFSVSIAILFTILFTVLAFSMLNYLNTGKFIPFIRKKQ